MEKIRVAILDSGIRKNHPAFTNKSIKGFSIKVKGEDIAIGDDIDDNIGHGTAIFYLIDKLSENVTITNIKIYDNNNEIRQNDLEKILEHIYENYDFDIINISMGFVRCGSIHKLQKICKAFYDKGTLIVSAFDNNGAVSFPAALDYVIGVDSQRELELSNEYVYVENSIINIIGKSQAMRVAWLDPDYISISGNSFVCAKVTASISKFINDNGAFDIELFCDKKIFIPKAERRNIPFTIHKAAVFPFNKEVHALARFENDLNFQIVNYYSIRITGNVEKKISQVLLDCQNNRTIKDIDEIDWDEFDTLIIGHVQDLSKLTNREYQDELINKAINNKKNIYCFDKPSQHNNQLLDNKYRYIYYPRMNSHNIVKRYGKLYKTNKPILSVIGTNSKQGKFTLQLLLRRKFKELGYSVGQIGTEPTALLFGMDEIFHCGYNGQIDLTIPQTYTAVNEMIWDITQKDVDIIITGTQSGFLAYNDYNAMMFPAYHRVFFSAVQPDAIVVCINPYDEVRFVERIIKTAEGISGGKVIGIVCYPIDISNDWKGTFGRTKRIDEYQENQIKKRFGLDVYMLDRPDDVDKLVKNIIDYFTPN